MCQNTEQELLVCWACMSSKHLQGLHIVTSCSPSAECLGVGRWGPQELKQRIDLLIPCRRLSCELPSTSSQLEAAYFPLQATQAYLAGNKAAAKELGAKGREHSEQMKKAHAAASENIFQQRNSRLQSAAGFNKNGEGPVQAEAPQALVPLARLEHPSFVLY